MIFLFYIYRQIAFFVFLTVENVLKEFLIHSILKALNIVSFMLVLK